MNIEIRHLDRTFLQEEALLKVIKKYSHNLNYNILISFDKKISGYGLYNFDLKKKCHIIKISLTNCCFTENEERLDTNSEKYNLISTLIHELCHANQKETLGSTKFWSNKYGCAKFVKNEFLAGFYSKSEVEARIYENKHVLQAVELYNDSMQVIEEKNS
jgi:HSP90 family molecular chaperone